MPRALLLTAAVFLLALGLGACGGEEGTGTATATVKVTKTATPTKVASPSATVARAVTQAATKTPQATATPAATKTPQPSTPTPPPLTPTPEPATPTPPPAAQETPTPAPVTLSLQIVSVTSPVSKGANATAVAQTSPGASCSITVTYKSGPSQAQGLVPKTADASGQVSWTWKVGTNTTPGDWPIDIACSFGGQSQSAHTSFTVQ